MVEEKVIVSCPGKVLITGGYLVLDRQYSGLVIATSSRFYTVIKPSKKAQDSKINIKVSSPQFLDGNWEYHMMLDGNPLELVKSVL